jgi:hypothetical protein
MMLRDRGHMRRTQVRLLPSTAAADRARLTLKCQTSQHDRRTLSIPSGERLMPS